LGNLTLCNFPILCVFSQDQSADSLMKAFVHLFIVAIRCSSTNDPLSMSTIEITLEVINMSVSC